MSYREIVLQARQGGKTDRVSNAGTSEGVRKAWEKRKAGLPSEDSASMQHGASEIAVDKSEQAYKSGTALDHHIAARQHETAANNWRRFSQGSGFSQTGYFRKAAQAAAKWHEKMADQHYEARSVRRNSFMRPRQGTTHVKNSRASYFSVLSERLANGRVARLVANAARARGGADPVTLRVLKHRAEIADWNERQKNDLTQFDDDRVGNTAERIAGPCSKIPECTGGKVCNRFAMPSDGWIHIAPIGEHPHPKGLVQVLDNDSVNRMVSNFKEQKKDPNFPGLLVDRDHVSQSGTTEAAGWITNLQARTDGLWANVAWTDEGKRDVESGTFRLVSPVWKRSDCVPVNGKPEHYCKPIALDSLALTNDPNMKGLTPITKVV